MLEVLLDNKDGNVWDISELSPSVTWSTYRIGKPGKLDLTMIKSALKYNNGDILRVRSDILKVFYGYIFNIGEGKSEKEDIVTYDQLRYLLANDTYVFVNATASEMVKRIAGDFGLKIGVIEDTGYKIPALIEDNKPILDMIYKALDLTLIATGKNFVLFDDFGELSLRNIENLKTDFVIGDGSLLNDFDYKRSIDNDTYNRIKLVQNNKSTGKRDVYITQDSANIAKWGRLQLYQPVDENMNQAQINELLNQLLELKNRERKSVQLKAIGDFRVRAGYYVPVIIDEIGLNQDFLVDECVHRVNGNDHTMSLKLKVI